MPTLVKRRCTVAAVVGLTVSGALAAGCSNGIVTAGGGNKTIGIATADLTSDFFIAAVDGVKQYAQAHGYQVIVESADNDSSRQVNQVQDLITRQVAAIVYIPAGAAAADVPVLAANQAGIPVVAVDRQPSSGKGKLVSFIASDSVKAAQQLCDWMAQQIHGKGNIAALQGQLGTTPEVARATGCAKALKSYPGVHVVAQQTANWDENQAFAATQNILSANPDLAAIFGHSDAMALGAAKAAQQAGKKPVIVGIDGFPTMFAAIRAGQVSGTVAQQPYRMGQLAAQDSILAAQGKAGSIPRTQLQPTYLVTQANINQFAGKDFYGPRGQ
jgi:ribose transport system substrate-binding protein